MPYFKRQKYEIGMKILDSAIQIEPAELIDYRAFMKCIFVKSYTSAIEDFLLSKKLKGEHGYIMDHSYDFYIGLCYLQLNQYSEAIENLQKA